MFPGPRHRGSLPCGRYLLAPLTGNKEGCKCLIELRVKPTPTRFPTNSLYVPMDYTPMPSISSGCHPWDNCWRVREDRSIARVQGQAAARNQDFLLTITRFCGLFSGPLTRLGMPLNGHVSGRS